MTAVLGTDLDSPNILRANATEKTAPRFHPPMKGWPYCCAAGCYHAGAIYQRETVKANMDRFVAVDGVAYCKCCIQLAGRHGVEAFDCAVPA